MLFYKAAIKCIWISIIHEFLMVNAWWRQIPWLAAQRCMHRIRAHFNIIIIEFELDEKK